MAEIWGQGQGGGGAGRLALLSLSICASRLSLRSFRCFGNDTFHFPPAPTQSGLGGAFRGGEFPVLSKSGSPGAQWCLLLWPDLICFHLSGLVSS